MEDNKSYSKNYYEKNKTKIINQVQQNYKKNIDSKREYYLSYYQKNKERIASKNKEKVVCEHCKGLYARQYFNKHVCISEPVVELKEVVVNFD